MKKVVVCWLVIMLGIVGLLQTDINFYRAACHGSWYEYTDKGWDSYDEKCEKTFRKVRQKKMKLVVSPRFFDLLIAGAFPFSVEEGKV